MLRRRLKVLLVGQISRRSAFVLNLDLGVNFSGGGTRMFLAVTAGII